MRGSCGAFLLLAHALLGSEPQAAPPVVANPEALVVREIGSPMYSELEQKGHFHGTVVISAVVSPTGATRDISISKGLNPHFDLSCVAAVEHTRFQPRLKGADQPVTFTFAFVLEASGPQGTYAVCGPCPFSWRVVGWAASNQTLP